MLFKQSYARYPTPEQIIQGTVRQSKFQTTRRMQSGYPVLSNLTTLWYKTGPSVCIMLDACKTQHWCIITRISSLLDWIPSPLWFSPCWCAYLIVGLIWLVPGISWLLRWRTSGCWSSCKIAIIASSALRWAWSGRAVGHLLRRWRRARVVWVERRTWS